MTDYFYALGQLRIQYLLVYGELLSEEELIRFAANRAMDYFDEAIRHFEKENISLPLPKSDFTFPALDQSGT